MWRIKNEPFCKNWVNIFVVPIFSTFGRYVTNLRGTFVKNVKKSPKSTHLTSFSSDILINSK
jgi:hypothetical protein